MFYIQVNRPISNARMIFPYSMSSVDARIRNYWSCDKKTMEKEDSRGELGEGSPLRCHVSLSSSCEKPANGTSFIAEPYIDAVLRDSFFE